MLLDQPDLNPPPRQQQRDQTPRRSRTDNANFLHV